MNTLRILKGSDINIYVDDTLLCFVTQFEAMMQRDAYEIKEMLSENAVDYVNQSEGYVIYITAYTHLNAEVFEKDGFTLSVKGNGKMFNYSSCVLESVRKVANGDKPIVFKYTIKAKNLNVSEVENE